MSRHLLTFFVTLLFALSVSAQPAQRGRAGFERVEAEKIAFFTRALELTSQEARNFWPLYDELQSKRNELTWERMALSKTFSDSYGRMTEKEALELADKYIGIQVREAEVAVEYHEKLKNVLSARKAMKLYETENEFRMYLLRRLGGGRGGITGDPGR